MSSTPLLVFARAIRQEQHIRSLSDGRVNELRLAAAVHQLFAVYSSQASSTRPNA